MPGGFRAVVDAGNAHDKFGFGPFELSKTAPTFWLVLVTALLEHLRNWGTDQSYIQRYLTARTEKEAARSIWIAGMLYIPVAFVFWFLGTGLFAYYAAVPGRLPNGTPADGVFPYFITHEVLVGLSGLVIAAIFAASMDSNLNSMATLTLVDGYKRYVRPDVGNRESLIVLWAGTIFWGVATIGWSLFMTLKDSTTTLQFMLNMSGLLAGGLLGLFLLGLISKRATSATAAVAVSVGVAVIVWMTLSRINVGARAVWPQRWNAFQSPLHEMYAGVIGTAVILVLGIALSVGRPVRRPGADVSGGGPGDDLPLDLSRA
jgi:SSS family solute:Na+ symporter